MHFTEDQRQLIRDSFANGASDAEFAVLMEIARARRLNPLLRQIHFVQRWDSDKHRMVWATQVSIDGLRALADLGALWERTTGGPLPLGVIAARRDLPAATFDAVGEPGLPPDVPVVGFSGDGAFGIAVTELTAIGRPEWPAVKIGRAHV